MSYSKHAKIASIIFAIFIIFVSAGCNDPPDPDWDNDDHPNEEDVFPYDPGEWADTDGDWVGDNSDAFPYDPDEWEDSDGDGVGDNGDDFPNDSSRWEFDGQLTINILNNMTYSNKVNITISKEGIEAHSQTVVLAAGDNAGVIDSLNLTKGLYTYTVTPEYSYPVTTTVLVSSGELMEANCTIGAGIWFKSVSYSTLDRGADGSPETVKITYDPDTHKNLTYTFKCELYLVGAEAAPVATFSQNHLVYEVGPGEYEMLVSLKNTTNLGVATSPGDYEIRFLIGTTILTGQTPNLILGEVALVPEDVGA